MAGRGRLGPLGDDRWRPRRGACRAGVHRARGAVPGVVPAFGRVGVGGAAAGVRGDRRVRGRGGQDARDAHQRGREPGAALAGGAVCRRGRGGRDAGPARAGPPDRLPPAAVAGGAGGPRRARSRRSRRRRGAGRLDLRSGRGACARPHIRGDGGLPALLRRRCAARLRGAHGAARDGQDRGRAHARARAPVPGLGGARVLGSRAALARVPARPPADVHRRRRVRVDRVPRRRGRALGARSRPDPQAQPTTCSCGRRGPRRCTPACVASTARTGCSVSPGQPR